MRRQRVRFGGEKRIFVLTVQEQQQSGIAFGGMRRIKGVAQHQTGGFLRKGDRLTDDDAGGQKPVQLGMWLVRFLPVITERRTGTEAEEKGTPVGQRGLIS